MNTKNYLVLLFLGLISLNVSAQDFENYTPTASQAPLPADLMSSSTEKYINAQTDAERQKKRADRKAQDKFFLQTNFALDELLSSGKLLFNDPMTKYVQKVIDNLLKNDAELRAKIKLYMIRSASVNAFATDRGEIFVNVGLITKLETEAQLAFILCHEIQHFILKHNLNSYVVYDKIQKGQGVYKRKNKKYDRLVSQHSYTRTLEREADEKGLELFLTSGYNVKSVEGVFDLLELAHGTYANTKFDVSYFENEYVQFPAIYQKTAVRPVRPYEKDSDEDKFSTHPSVEERRKAFNATLASEGIKEEGKEFIQPKSAFDKVQKMARFDLCDILISYRSYPAALYHAYLILDKYPNNSYAEKTIAKALYGIAQYTNNDTYDDITISSDTIQGEMQSVFYLFEEMSKKEINTLASRYCWEMHKKYPDDKGLKRMAQDMIEDVVIFSIESPEEYFKKEKMTTSDIEKEQTFAPYAFADIMSDSTFTKWIANGKRYRKRNEDSEEEREEMGYYALSKKNRKAANKKRKKGAALNKKNVVFVNPFYLKADAKKKDVIRLIESEERQNKFKGWIEELGKDAGLKTTVLDVKHISEKTTIEDYNNIIAINRWVDELLTNDMYMISSNYNDVLSVVNEYNSTTFAYTGALSFRKKKNIVVNYYNLIYTVIPWTTPYGLNNLIKPSYETVYFSYVFDFENSRVLHREFNTMRQKDRDGVIKSNLYWLMHQIEQKPNKKKKK